MHSLPICLDCACIVLYAGIDCQLSVDYLWRRGAWNDWIQTIDKAMTQEQIAFIENNIINFEAVELGFTRHIEHNIMQEYERIYKAHLDAQFALNAWCGACVHDMLKRLKAHYEGYLYMQKKQSINQTNDQPKRAKKSNQNLGFLQ